MRCYCSQLIYNLQNNFVVSHLFTFLPLLKSGMQYICLLQTIKDWMTVWIERCQHSDHGLKWESMSSLVKQAHFDRDPNEHKRK